MAEAANLMMEGHDLVEGWMWWQQVDEWSRTGAGIDAVGKENARHQTQKKELGTGAVVANSRGASGSRVSRGWAGLCRLQVPYGTLPRYPWT